ncbi:MAG: hypothetical protein GY943_22850 [Chloroflexi bacterium]|nr:hypothetical protein [Chloroflexota bacterium]
MKAVKQRVQGKLIEQNGRFHLYLTDPKPDRDAANLLYLRYAFVTLGPEDHIFPSFILDDWGNEIRGVKLYNWVRDNGNEFPRAEIFGYETDGQETQLFTRELELYVKLPCFAYTNPEAQVTEGVRLSSILLPDADTTEPTLVKRPSATQIKRPLRAARVKWWHIPITTTINDIDLLIL